MSATTDLQALGVDVHQNYLALVGGKNPADRLSDTGGAACDDGDFSFEQRFLWGTYVLSFQVSGVRCQVSGVGCRVSGVGCRVSGVGCQVSGVRCRVSGVRCRVSGVGCRVSGVGCQVSGVGLLFKNDELQRTCHLATCHLILET